MVTRKKIITDEWIAQVRAWLEQEGVGSQTVLAKRVGCSSAAITYILEGSQQSSKHVAAISRVTGADLPPEATITDEEARLLERYSLLSDSQRQILNTTLDLMMDKKVSGRE